MEFRNGPVAGPEIIYEDENFLAVNKPAGLIVHEARSMKHETRVPRGKKNVSRFTFHVSGKEPTLVDWLVKKYPEIKNVGDDPETRPGIVHRLDKDASGVMLVAKNQNYFEYLKSLFQNRQIKKTYLAVVAGEMKDARGVIDRPLGIKNGTLKRSVHSDKMAKEAVTEYREVKSFRIPEPDSAEIPNSKFACSAEAAASATKAGQIQNSFSWLEVYPKTGRTHQIRVHLASIGHPIVGDKLYGRRKILNSKFQIPNSRLMLHALSLEFTDKSGRRIKIEADLPGEFEKFIEIRQ